jgi:hypothetical protein
MSIELQPTTLATLPAVTSLLASAFTAPPDAAFLDRRLWLWKYFEPGPRWNETRSYVLTKAGEIQAHCGVVPFNLRFSGQEVSCIHPTDWAGGRQLPGAGVLLMKKLLNRAETAIVVGGSDDTRLILPKIGFAAVGAVTSFARIVRPWKQFRTRPAEPPWKATARLLRNTGWSRSLTGPIPKGWFAVMKESFETIPNCQRDSHYPTPSRDAQYVNYWLRCPTAEVLGYEIMNDRSVLGYFVLSRIGRQARIADIRLNSGDPDDWHIAYRLAAKAASRNPETCEIVAAASTPLVSASLTASGFRNRGSVPLFLYDPQKKLAGAPPMFWNMIDGDAAYLQDPAYPFVT